MATRKSAKPKKKVDTFELLVRNERMYMSSLDIAEITGKEHKNIVRDIRKLLEELGDEIGEDVEEDGSDLSRPRSRKATYLVGKYRNSQNKLQPVFYLNRELTFTLLTGYSAKLRHKIIQRWLRLESGRSSARSDSVSQRNRFTQVLKDHGYTKSYEYSNTTQAMKRPLEITAGKRDMTERELKLVRAAEYLAEAFLTDECGYREVNPVCVSASRAAADFLLPKLGVFPSP